MASALHPISDNIKVRIDPPNRHGFKGGDESIAGESGVVVEMPVISGWLGFHSFAFENSFDNGGALEEALTKYGELLMGKRVFWESFQDSGRRIKEGDEEFVFLKLTDIIAYSDDVDVKAKTVNDARRAGSFNV